MTCPLCAGEMEAVERLGIELDHCVQCGGLWLDQGELNELVRRESVAAVEEGQRALAASRHERDFDAIVPTWEPKFAFTLV